MTRLFLLNRTQGRLGAEERAVLDDACEQVRELPARHILVRAGERVHTSTLLLDGFICRYMDDNAGARQLVAIHVPGDFVDLHGFPLQTLEHDVAAMGPVTIASWSHETLVRITEGRPHLTRMLWYATLLDAAIHREWIFRLGRLGAEGRLAHLICELYVRLEAVGLTRDGRFTLPLKQADLAEACGLTNVHINRVLRSIREQGIMTFRSGEVVVHDMARLRKLGEFEPSYLYIDPQ
ncbi:Crp/Fnr family transcriptional regulator [Sphingomonas sp. KR1UV-12]|uniref:Crp/Fnr family transcriptional regulator n=1 Tax=Sphingomonas aurea TaxID=3063994 RepID=A0ABT9EIG2_9SPHN|nr:Crp/Fnr family transcriptional regulator [Sphingomonas sp. KR1UV-12]MDP1026566.1 Crp/Fnr family transcriptional regulator [Sphingomonas sp. KR1UV-12]